jgi:hypothetical protein
MAALRVASPGRLGFLLVIVVACGVYWLTAYPTITWWDSSVYSLAAVTLGIAHPPGSFLLTVLGWLVTRLPLGLPPAYALNLFAGALAALASGLVYLVALRLLRLRGPAGHGRPPGAAVVGAALGALAFAFGVTLWDHAVKLTPYVLTAVVTGLLLLVMVRWWEDADRDDAWRWLLILGLLFGLDFSVHRTNLLLLPGLLAWLLLRRPRTLLSARAWLAGTGGAVAGLAFHLLIMPRAAADPVLNVGNPDTWRRFYEYVSLAQYGGGFLIRFFPRHAPIWSVQVMDVARAAGADFFGVTGPLGMASVLPGVLGVIGSVLLWRRQRRLGAALMVLMLAHAAATVLYFNIPANFFRPFTRHYLPVFVPFAVTAAYGLGRALERVADLSWGRERYAVALAAVLAALVPGSQLVRNHAAVSGAGQYFAEDFARNLLGGLPPEAVLFTSGDNDTWPLWYMQAVEGVRPDVRVVNLPLTNADWFVEQLVRRDASLPPGIAAGPAARPWSDTTITIPVDASPDRLGLPRGSVVPRATAIRASPTTGGAVLRQDLVMLRMIEEFRWRRPVCLSPGVAPDRYPWFAPYRRVDGLHARLVPLEDPPADIATLRATLLDGYEYRGYADDRVRLDDVTRLMGRMYYPAFLALAEAEYRAGEPGRCRETHEVMTRLLPPRRLGPGISLDVCR